MDSAFSPGRLNRCAEPSGAIYVDIIQFRPLICLLNKVIRSL